MSELVTRLESDDTWLCHHVDSAGIPTGFKRLRLDDTQDWPHRVSNSRRWTNCPECGTRWRVWVQLRVAKPSTCWDPAFQTPPSLHAPQRDIDHIVSLIRHILPQVSVVQWEDAWPADDDGIWYFRVPHIKGEIQLESSTGMCPFFIEHDGMPSPADGGGWTASTTEETAKMVLSYFTAEAGAESDAPAS